MSAAKERRRQFFSPLIRAAKPHKVAAFDTEGIGGPGGFVCGSVVCDCGRFSFTDPSEMLRYLCSPELRGTWLFAHNLEYDLGVLTSGDLRAFSCLFTDNRILWAETQDPHGHKWRFCDSLNLFPDQSVADLGRLVGLRKVGLPDRLHQHLRAGMQLHKLAHDDRDYITEYCLIDAEIVYLAVSMLQEELLGLGGRLRPTIAGCSMDLYRRHYLVDPWPTPTRGDNNLARLGYYGARTEPYRLGLARGLNAYDVNSLYPAVQREIEFPHPGALSIYPGSQCNSSVLDRPGLSQVTVLVPDREPPPLPKKVGTHLFFPTGELTGVWPHNELNYALDHGARLKTIDWTLVASRTFNPFTEFIDDLYKRRLLHASDGDIRAQTFKLLLNSAYGRYGINPDEGLYNLVPIPPDPDWEKFRGGELRMINNWPYSLMPVSGGRQPAYCNVLIASYISAAARIRMHQEISQVVDRLVYTDTDCLFMEGELPTGERMGEMKKEHAGIDVWCVAPKEYAVFSGEHLIDAHVKGVPEEYRMLYLETGRARFERPTKIREASLRNESPAVWVEQLKARRQQVPKRAPDLFPLPGQEYYQTRAWSLPELLDLVEGRSLLPQLDLKFPTP